MSSIIRLIAVPLAAAFAASALAVPDYGHEWRTIGDAGNAPTTPSDKHPFFPRPLGAVDYEYRLTRTEVTSAQQFDFLLAYGPHMEQGVGEIGSWGDVSFLGFGQDGPIWRLDEGRENRPARMSPRLWMRYCNWLHNDKALTADAFDSGAYDASTFGRDADGNLTDQMTRSPGARFWIPSIDEWVKGGYWDPNRYGNSEGGYWGYPTQSDDPPAAGAPENGGETNAFGGENIPLDVGSYPDVETPWGLLDYSGGAGEVAERLNDSVYVQLGSWATNGSTSLDRLGHPFAALEIAPVGLRLASIPAPSTASTFALLALAARRRR